MYNQMRRAILYLGITSLTFGVGVSIGMRWKAFLDHQSSTAHPEIHSEEPQWTLTDQLVRRSLQTHSFRSDKVRRNSNDEVVWRWLKESIAQYPQNWFQLKISEGESYGVVLYPMTVLEPQEIIYYNRQLKAKKLPILDPAKQYLPINVYRGDIICPNWAGLIDVEEAKLVFFEGGSA
jgi:hypothetical protein